MIARKRDPPFTAPTTSFESFLPYHSFSPDATVEIYNRFGATVHENFGGIQTDVVKNQYKKIFPEFFPRIKIHWNDISHSGSDLDWQAMWQLVEDMSTSLEVEIYLALKHLPTWNVNIPKYVIKIAKSRYIHSALIISQSFIALALEIANKILAAEFGGIKLLLSFADTKTQAPLPRPNL